MGRKQRIKIVLLFFALIFCSVSIAQDLSKSLMVEYVYTNEHYSNNEILTINKNGNAIYIHMPLTQKNNVNFIEPVEGSDNEFKINQKLIQLVKLKRYIFSDNNVVYSVFTDDGEDIMVVDSLPEMKWELILGQNKEIAGFNCQKATLNFRGRKFTAFFTEDIPVNYGPWKFKGLPGLILEISSENGNLGFHSWNVNRVSFSNQNQTQLLAEKEWQIPELKTMSLKQYEEFKYARLLKQNAINDSRLPKGVTVSETNIQRLGIELIYEWEESDKD